MRYLKITSAENPNNDFIELNDFNGFLCTSFSTLGISRQFEVFSVGNRQFSVDNKPKFKDYSLTVHILTKYSLYEQYYRELINFFDRNKKGGFRLYYNPYNGNRNDERTRYILCDIKTTTKAEKMQPITLTVQQNSLWIGATKSADVVSIYDSSQNVFEFKEDEKNYYCAAFKEDEEDYYCISFYNGVTGKIEFSNNCYNKIPTLIRIYGESENPIFSLFKKGETTAIHTVQIFTTIDKNHYVEINSSIEDNGVWLVNKDTKQRDDYSGFVNNSLGSPYIYLEQGEYEITVSDSRNNAINSIIFFNEEYSE